MTVKTSQNNLKFSHIENEFGIHGNILDFGLLLTCYAICYVLYLHENHYFVFTEIQLLEDIKLEMKARAQSLTNYPPLLRY